MAKSKSATYLERKGAKLYEKVDVWQGRIARILVILLMCVQPLYLNQDRYIALTGHKFWFFFVCMCIVLFGVIVVWTYRLLTKPRLLFQEKLSVVDWAVLGFAAVTLLSALMSPFKEFVNVWIGIPEPGGRYDGAITQLMFVSVFLIVSRWYRPRERDFVIFGFSAIIVALIGILQFYGMDFLSLWPNHISQFYAENFYNIYFRTTLGNINIVATYVCVAILLCGFLYVKVSSKWRYVWLAASALCFWMMILASSFSGMVGTAVATALAVPFLLVDKKALGRFFILAASWLAALAVQLFLFNVRIMESRSASILLPFAAMIFVLLALGLLLLKFAKEPAPDAPVNWRPIIISIVGAVAVVLLVIEVVGRNENTAMIYQAREVMHGNIQDTFGSFRIFIWRNALSVFSNYPIIGTGPDTFFFAFPMEAHGVFGENYDKAHNEYLQILICQGILGLLFYLVFLGGVFIKSITKVFKNPILFAVVAAFVGYCVQAFFNISLPIASQIMWIFAGMMVNKRLWETAA